MKIEMGKKYRNTASGLIYTVIAIDRDNPDFPVVIEHNNRFTVLTFDGCGHNPSRSYFEEYTPEPELINMRDKYESEGLPAEIFKITDVDVIVLTYRGVFSFDFEGHFYAGKKDYRDLVKVESRPEMVIYKIRYADPVKGPETSVIASPAGSLRSWLEKMGTKCLSIEILEGLKYTGDSTEPVVIG